MKDYGAQVYGAGVVLHGDGRRRVSDGDRFRPAVPGVVTRGDRGAIRAFSTASQRRLEFIAANAAGRFQTLLTLTYHAVAEKWEDDGERNWRIVVRSKRDLNRFLTSMRPVLGAYLWVQEFQARGVIHYHVLCEGTPTHEAVTLAWTRATDELDDTAALQRAVKVDPVRGDRQVRSYIGRYIGKGRQKSLPKGVEGAGRWWGRSNGLGLDLKREIVTQAREEDESRGPQVRVLRSFRRWLSKRLGFRVRGGTYKDWQGRFSGAAVGVLDELATFYDVPASEMLVAQSGTPFAPVAEPSVVEGRESESEPVGEAA